MTNKQPIEVSDVMPFVPSHRVAVAMNRRMEEWLEARGQGRPMFNNREIKRRKKSK